MNRFPKKQKTNSRKTYKDNKKNGSSKANWVYKVFFLAFGLSIFFSFISENLLNKFNIFISLFMLFLIILVGILFDIIGIAVTSATEKPFHAMAADKIPGGKEAVQLIRNADIVSNFCNDVVGDISGIISGAAGATIVLKIIENGGVGELPLSILMSGFISTLTIGGKALGKILALGNSKNIVYNVALLIYFVQKRFNIRILPK